MSTFEIQRNLPTKIKVNFEDIKPSDLRSMPRKALERFTRELMHQYRIKGLQSDPQSTIKHQRTSAVVPADKLMGRKIGKTSKYHYVWIDADAVDHRKFVAGVTLLGRKIIIGTYADEKTAALAADAYLDEINDTKRPRNAQEFSELQTEQDHIGGENDLG